MSTLRQFSDKERDYDAYQARQNFLREQLTIQHELDEERQAKLEALADKELALELIKQKDAELEKLKALLAKNNLNS
jgi:hypothetical protein